MPRDWEDKPYGKPSPAIEFVLGVLSTLILIALMIGAYTRLVG